MKNISIHILIFISVMLPIQAAENFLQVNLPNNVSVELPQNWIIMSQDHMIARAIWGEGKSKHEAGRHDIAHKGRLGPSDGDQLAKWGSFATVGYSARTPS